MDAQLIKRCINMQCKNKEECKRGRKNAELLASFPPDKRTYEFYQCYPAMNPVWIGCKRHLIK